MNHFDKTNVFKSRMITEKPQQRGLQNLKAVGSVPMVDTAGLKQAFLAGDKDAVMYCNKNDLNPSNYQRQHKGVQIYRDHARIVDDYRTTLAGSTVPDPATLRATANRFNGFSMDLAGSKSMQDVLKTAGSGMFAKTDTSGIVFQSKSRFGGEENDGTKTGPIMQKRFKRTTGHFYQ